MANESTIVYEFVTLIRVRFEIVCEFVTHQWEFDLKLFVNLLHTNESSVSNCYVFVTSITVRFKIVCKFVTHQWEFDF
jgi:hypothetical protein